MKSRNCIALILFAILVISGCASTKVTSRHELVTQKLPRPAHIWVYDFAATPADVSAEAALAGKHSEHYPPQTGEQIAAGRKLGAEIEAQLVEDISAMGLPAEHAVKTTTPQINDLVIQGYLISYNEGSAGKRIMIGFGSGATDLKVAVEGFQMTAHGLRKLGGGTTASEGAKTPGADLGVAGLLATHNPVGLLVSSGMKIYDQKTGKSTIQGRVRQTVTEIADILKKRFQEQGWIK